MKTRTPKFVYRFIPVHRLLEIIESNEISFIRHVMWEDPLEGYFVKQYIELVNNGLHPPLRPMKYSDYTDLRFFLCCTKNQEKDYQWRYYTPNKDGVRIKLSKLDLLNNAKKNYDIDVKPVKYENLREFDNALNRFRKAPSQAVNNLLFYKRAEFIDEREIRFLIQTGHDSNVLPVKIDSCKVIQELLFDPRMSSRSFEVYAEFVLKKWPKIKIEHSNLYDPDRSIKYIEQ